MPAASTPTRLVPAPGLESMAWGGAGTGTGVEEVEVHLQEPGLQQARLVLQLHLERLPALEVAHCLAGLGTRALALGCPASSLTSAAKSYREVVSARKTTRSLTTNRGAAET